jgi:hypothetical protein
LLATGLWNTNIAGKSHEYLHKKLHIQELQWKLNKFDLNEYIETSKIRRKSENGAYGFKAQYYQ